MGAQLLSRVNRPSFVSFTLLSPPSSTSRDQLFSTSPSLPCTAPCLLTLPACPDHVFHMKQAVLWHPPLPAALPWIAIQYWLRTLAPRARSASSSRNIDTTVCLSMPINSPLPASPHAGSVCQSSLHLGFLFRNSFSSLGSFLCLLFFPGRGAGRDGVQGGHCPSLC